MFATTSIMGLHLHYRLWISELNHDINVLRIFDDYLEAIKVKELGIQSQNGVDEFRQSFMELRKNIDDLRHLMHLNKMKLAAESREKENLPEGEPKPQNHQELEQRYIAFKSLFDHVKNEFIAFEAKWLQ